MAAFIIMLLGIFGNMISAAFFLSPMRLFWRIWKYEYSMEGINFLPYVCALLSTTLWTYYGYITGQVFIIMINCLGCCTQAFYVVISLRCVPTSVKMKFVVLFVNVGIPVIAIVSAIAVGGESGTLWLGGSCALLTAIMYLSSVSDAITAWRTRNVEFIAHWTLFFSFTNAVIWGLYGLINGDRSVQAANGVGILTGISQLIVYFYLKNTA